MPLNRYNTRTFHRTFYAGELEKVILYKRNDDMDASTVTKYTLFDCRWTRIFKMGEPIQGDMSSDHRRRIQVPRSELDRIGVDHLNALDVFVDLKGRYWRPESMDRMDINLFENHMLIPVQRVDPPKDLVSQ